MHILLENLQHIDNSVFHFINQTISHPALDVILLFIRNPYSWIPLYLLLLGYLLNRYKSRSLQYVIYILIAFTLADALSAQLLKPFFGRLRPCHSSTLQVRQLLGYCGGKYGFPSTHAANHFAIALSIVLTDIFTKKWIKMLWIFWALLIGFAQIYAGVHYPSDVIAGFIFGAIIACLNYFLILPFLKKAMKRKRKN